jgi:malonyl CoA-acyl carrier protein transacylase
MLAACAAPGVCSIALHNSPRQQVLSGHRESILRVVESLDNDFVEHAFIDDRLAMHSSLMRQASWKFRQSLEEVPWAAPRSPYLPNAIGRFLAHPSRNDFIDLLTRHIHEPVLWRESLDLVTSTAPQPILLEVGPKGILQAMAGRRWLTCPVHKADTEDNFQAHFETLVQELMFGQRELAIAHSQG